MSINDMIKAFFGAMFGWTGRTRRKTKKEGAIFSRPDIVVKDRKGRNSIGRVLTATCPICGKKFVAHIGWPNKQCGAHLQMQTAPKAMGRVGKSWR